MVAAEQVLWDAFLLANSPRRFLTDFECCEKNGACDSLQFYAGFKPDGRDLAFVNKWNIGKRFSQLSTLSKVGKRL